jgi:hypothetical protein
VFVLRRAEAFRGGLHDLRVSHINLKGTILRPVICCLRSVHHEPAIEAVRSAEPLFADLMAHGTRHAVFRLLALLVLRGEWKMGKHLALHAVKVRFVSCHGHVADGTFVFYVRLGLGMINRFAPHACLPLRVTSGISHHGRAPVETDGDVFTRRRKKTVVTRDTAVGRLEFGRQSFLAASTLPQHGQGE